MQGVRIVARAEAWSGIPASLAEELTPLLITVTNESEHAIRVSHEGFALVIHDGRRYDALAPLRIDRVIPGPVIGRPVRYTRLPTTDMRREALPEGVLEPHGEVSGFVYFERLPPDEGRVELRAQFPQAEGESTRRMEIPFRVTGVR